MRPDARVFVSGNVAFTSSPKYIESRVSLGLGERRQQGRGPGPDRGGHARNVGIAALKKRLALGRSQTVNQGLRAERRFDWGEGSEAVRLQEVEDQVVEVAQADAGVMGRPQAIDVRGEGRGGQSLGLERPAERCGIRPRDPLDAIALGRGGRAHLTGGRRASEHTSGEHREDLRAHAAIVTE